MSKIKKKLAPRKPTPFSIAKKDAYAAVKRARTAYTNAKRNAKSYGQRSRKK